MGLFACNIYSSQNSFPWEGVSTQKQRTGVQHVIMNRNQQKRSLPCLAQKLDTLRGAGMHPWEQLLHPLAPQASCLLVGSGQAGIVGEARLASDASSVSPARGRAQQTCRSPGAERASGEAGSSPAGKRRFPKAVEQKAHVAFSLGCIYM